MVAHLNWNAAALSLLVPGWGQYEQGRVFGSRVFLAWSALALLAAFYGPLLGMSSLLGWADLVASAVWSAADVLVRTIPPRAVAA
jgi:hypothetical protein